MIYQETYAVIDLSPLDGKRDRLLHGYLLTAGLTEGGGPGAYAFAIPKDGSEAMMTTCNAVIEQLEAQDPKAIQSLGALLLHLLQEYVYHGATPLDFTMLVFADVQFCGEAKITGKQILYAEMIAPNGAAAPGGITYH
jgi:hypothetical protein